MSGLYFVRISSFECCRCDEGYVQSNLKGSDGFGANHLGRFRFEQDASGE